MTIYLTYFKNLTTSGAKYICKIDLYLNFARKQGELGVLVFELQTVVCTLTVNPNSMLYYYPAPSFNLFKNYLLCTFQIRLYVLNT